MKRAILIPLTLLLISKNMYAQKAALNKATRDSIIQLLFKVDDSDQQYRNQIDGVREKHGAESKEMQELFGKMKTADSLNTIIVSGVIDKYGWLGAKEIGEQCNVTLFVVIQHAELDDQVKYLPVLRDAVKKGNARAKDLALLEDRVALKHGNPQIYGSQVLWNMKENSNVVAPLADPDNVDKRRALIGLGPLSEYVSAFGIEWNVEKYKKELLQTSYSQKNYDFANIKEYNFYRLDYNDSFKIAYYKSGALKYEQKEEHEIWYYYIDSSKNDTLYSSVLTLPRFPYQNCKDSTRDIYKYNDGKLSEINTYNKVCYKERDGCFMYDNTNAGEWCLTERQFFKFNEQKDCIEQTLISEHNNRLDTTIFRSEYTYDTQGRKTQYRLFENGVFNRKVDYKYFEDIVREEFYYPEDSSARVITDYKYQNGLLVEMFVDRKYNGTSNTERYLYIIPNRLSSIEYISDRTNLYKVRKYYYE